MDTLPSHLVSILKTARTKQIEKGQIILYQGDQARDVFVLKSGTVKLYDIDEQGNEKVLHLMQNPAIIPFAFFSGAPTPTLWFYSALTDCELYEVPQVQLLRELRKNSELVMYSMNWFSKEMHGVLTLLSSLGKTNVRDKLLAVLRSLQARYSAKRRGDWWRVTFPVTHQLLADIVGITRESAALAMKGLQDERIVRYPKLGLLEINAAKLGV